jgi:hypothetical protein
MSRRTAKGLAACALALAMAMALAACGGGEETPEPAAPAAAAREDAGATPGAARRGGARRGAAEPDEPTELPAQVQGLVRSEMTRLETDMQRLLAFIARGNGAAAATLARQIERAAVVEPAAPGEERRLHADLPRGFIERDRAFHRRAGTLAEALEDGDFATASKTYAAMTRMCVSCHALYAAHRFPTLAGAAEDGGEDAP